MLVPHEINCFSDLPDHVGSFLVVAILSMTTLLFQKCLKNNRKPAYEILVIIKCAKDSINSWPSGNFFPLFFLSSVDFFKIKFFEKFFQEYYQSVAKNWIQIRPDILSGQIWVQAVCKGYQQATKVTTNR